MSIIKSAAEVLGTPCRGEGRSRLQHFGKLIFFASILAVTSLCVVSICTVSMVNLASAAGDKCELAARGYAGFGYRDLTSKDLDSLLISSPSGVLVNLVVPGSPADSAGLKTGDVLKVYDGENISDSSNLLDAIRSHHSGDAITLDVLRRGKPVRLGLTLGTAPRESAGDLDIEYTCFESAGTKLRAVITSPAGSAGMPLPALLMISALGSPRFTPTSSFSMTSEIAYAAARKGFRVMRFELRGYGDSEGDDYRTTDFNAEVADNLAAFDYLAGRSDVAGTRVFVFGHSTGGMVGSLVAGQRPCAGFITSCTVGRTFYERSLETLRLQSELGGDSPAKTDEKLKDYMNLMTSAARGDSLQTILLLNPELGKYFNSDGRIMDDRTLDYWREQLNLNLADAYGKISEPVLIVYCASDFLTQQACHEHIRDVLVASGNKDVTLEIVPDADHGYAFAKDKRDAFANYRKRNREGNPDPINRITAWLLSH